MSFNDFKLKGGVLAGDAEMEAGDGTGRAFPRSARDARSEWRVVAG